MRNLKIKAFYLSFLLQMLFSVLLIFWQIWPAAEIKKKKLTLHNLNIRNFDIHFEFQSLTFNLYKSLQYL